MDRKAEPYAHELMQGGQFLRRGKAMLAAKVLRKILVADSHHYQANYSLGKLYNQEGPKL